MSAVQVRPFRRDDYRAFLPAVGFRELTRTRRGWIRIG
jgi:hypothetical protein